MNEVFCKDCKYFKHWKIGAEFFDMLFDNLDTSDKCKHPGNLSTRNRYNKREKVYLHDPEYLNSSNNCHWYVRKVGLLRLLLELLFRKSAHL